MVKNYLWFTLLLIFMLVLCGDLFAGRLANISDAVSGADYQKMKQLKNVAFGAGLLFMPLGILLYFNHKKLMVPVAVSIVMLLLGTALVAVKFVL